MFVGRAADSTDLFSRPDVEIALCVMTKMQRPRLSVRDRLHRVNLAELTDRPDIHSRSIHICDDDLGGPVPAGCDVVGVATRGPPRVHRACKAEVAQLEDALLRDQDVCWFDVAVEDLCNAGECGKVAGCCEGSGASTGGGGCSQLTNPDS